MVSIALYMPATILACLILRWSYKAINWLWLKPRRVETCLRRQGFKGNSYRFLHGDTKDNLKMIQEASSKPIHLSDDITHRVDPYFSLCRQTFGKNFIMWMGPKPRVHVMEPELIREVFNKNNDFQKPPLNPLAALLAKGLASYEGDKWAKHRKLINPAFHSEKLKNMMPAFHHSTNEMVCKWEKLALASANKSCELDVWQDLQTMTRDAISRTAFGSSYEEGKRIFELQRELTGLVVLASLSVYVPGWRFVPAGVLVTVPILSIQRDPQLWGEDAHEFKPDRFSEGVSNATKGQIRFIPFIWGPRICIGQNFALLEGKMAMALVLQRFSFELSHSYTHAPYSRISLQPQHGANLILRKL